MSIIKFRRLHKCQNGHKNYLYFELHGDKLENFKWGEDNCDCPKLAIGEGYSPTEDTEIVSSDYSLVDRDTPKKPVEIMFEGEDTPACPTCGNWVIGLSKYCCDCGQRLDHKLETHEDYSGV